MAEEEVTDTTEDTAEETAEDTTEETVAEPVEDNSGAKIAALEQELGEAREALALATETFNSEVNRLKALNYDLLVSGASIASGEDITEDTEEDPDESASFADMYDTEEED